MKLTLVNKNTLRGTDYDAEKVDGTWMLRGKRGARLFNSSPDDNGVMELVAISQRGGMWRRTGHYVREVEGILMVALACGTLLN